MTSREITRAAIEFKNPPRAPRHLWLLPWAGMTYPDELAQIQKKYPDDIVVSPEFLKQVPHTQGDPHRVGKYIDPWGCVFSNTQDGIIGEVKEPLITDEDWEDLSRVHIPTEWLSVDIEQVNAFCRSTDRWVNGAGRPRPFEQMQYIRGSENFYMDLAEPSQGMLDFMRKMHTFYCDLLEIWAKTEVDGLRIMDDWGAQRSLLISPKTWRELFKPMYRDYVEIARAHGKKIFMHSDGYILDIYPDLIEIGVDVLNSQVFCMGVENLRQYAGQICFWGEIDRQNLLPYGTPEQVAGAVKAVFDNLWQEGGCIAELEFGIGARPENVEAALAAWEQLFVPGKRE